MKITKDTQTVWKLENGHTIIGTRYDNYLVITFDDIMKYNKAEMIEVYGLTEDQFDNIFNSGI